MIYQILVHTPIWVFGLFFVLLALGLFLSKERTVPISKAFLFSVGMFSWSLINVLVSFRANPSVLLAWSLGVLVVWSLNFRLRLPRDITYLADMKQFHFSGGYSILSLIMLIFFARYVEGAMTGINPALKNTPSFFLTTSLIFGALSGVFFVRALAMAYAIKNAK